MGTAVTKRNYYKEDPSQTTKTVTVEPSEESKSTSLSMPTDPALQQELQRQIQAAQRAYGVNPQTGAVTPFEALGYNPEDERKRREAERALNDRKRKENAWYNAFAVLGDSLTAALGGNVWQRQPNNIGAQANADNARLIAEQKAEDEGNAAKLRAAGTAYANTVNQLIQNYLTKTSTTTKTGGNRTEVTDNPGKSGYRDSTHVVGDNNGSGSGSGGGGGNKIMNINTGSREKGNFKRGGYSLSNAQYDAVKGILEAYYQSILNEKDTDGIPTKRAEDLRQKLLQAGVLKKSVAGSYNIEQNDFENDMVMLNGQYWSIDDATAKRIEEATGGKVKFKIGWKPTAGNSQTSDLL